MLIGLKMVFLYLNESWSWSASCSPFLREIVNMFSELLSSYTNTLESLGVLKKAEETLASGLCSHSISPVLQAHLFKKSPFGDLQL